MRSVRLTIVAALGLVVALTMPVAAAPDVIETSASATVRAVRIGPQSPTQPLPAPPSARYRVTFVSEWTASSHPTMLPANAHFSPIVVVTHAQPADLIDHGGLATPGIESMAETGATATLRAELAGDATVTSTQVGTTIFGAGAQRFEVTLTQQAPLVSVVSMLAPTPDWFVGIEDQTMFADGEWSDRVDLDLEPYDAGTDSGVTFTSPDADTNPQQPIGGPRDVAFLATVAEGRFGSVTLERIA